MPTLFRHQPKELWRFAKQKPVIRAFQWDLGRQVERLEWLLAQLPRYAAWGYTELYLHLEDAIEYPSLPGVARADAYSPAQMRRLVSVATRAGIRIVPIVNLLGHTQYLIKVPALRDLNELRARDGSALEAGQICPLHPETGTLVEKLLDDVAPLCTAGKVHVGLDESFHLGKCARCREDIARYGRARHFAGHATQLNEAVARRGLRMGMWADMLYFIPDAIPLLPADVAVYEWYYYRFGRRPRVELFNFAESDVGEKIRARGMEYWGCPMNGAFRYEPLPHFGDRLDNVRSWWKRCQRMNAAGFLMTSWEPNRLAQELTTVIDAAAASLWLDRPGSSAEKMLANGFTRVFGGHGRKAARVALAADKYPFGGYPRWQINARWDVVSRREPLSACQTEWRHYERLARVAGRDGVPRPLQASVQFRRYLAIRDLFVRNAQRQSPTTAEIWQQRKEAALALRAARVMWTRTRDRKTTSPNQTIVEADRARLAALQRGDAMLGPRWQLCYRVQNFAPAVQFVAVEQQQPDGTWQQKQGCHTIEFQARAAMPRGTIRREHAAPIDWDGDSRSLPRLRFVVSGVGEVQIEEAVLTDGSAVLPTMKRRFRLGKPAPKRGWPNFAVRRAFIEFDGARGL